MLDITSFFRPPCNDESIILCLFYVFYGSKKIKKQHKFMKFAGMWQDRKRIEQKC